MKAQEPDTRQQWAVELPGFGLYDHFGSRVDYEYGDVAHDSPEDARSTLNSVQRNLARLGYVVDADSLRLVSRTATISYGEWEP